MPGLFAVQLAAPVSSGTHLNGYVIGTYDAYRLAAQAVEGEAEALRKRATWYANLWPGPLAAVKISKPARP